MPEKEQKGLSNRFIYGFLSLLLILLTLTLASVEAVRSNGKAIDKALTKLQGEVGFQEEKLNKLEPVVKTNELARVEIKQQLKGIDGKLSDIYTALIMWGNPEKESAHD